MGGQKERERRWERRRSSIVSDPHCKTTAMRPNSALTLVMKSCFAARVVNLYVTIAEDVATIVNINTINILALDNHFVSSFATSKFDCCWC